MTRKAILVVFGWRSRLADGCQADAVESSAKAVDVLGAVLSLQAFLLELEELHLSFHLPLLLPNLLQLLVLELSLFHVSGSGGIL